MAGMKKTKKMAKGGISAGIAKFKGKNGAKKMRGGGAVATKKMRGGGMGMKKKMRGGGMKKK